MSTHVLLNLLFIKQVGEKAIKCKAYQAFNRLFATSLISSIIQKHEC